MPKPKVRKSYEVVIRSIQKGFVGSPFSGSEVKLSFGHWTIALEFYKNAKKAFESGHESSYDFMNIHWPNQNQVIISSPQLIEVRTTTERLLVEEGTWQVG